MMYFLRQFLYYITYPLRALIYAPGKLFSGTGGRFLSLSLPARLAWLMATALVVVTIASVVAFYFTEDRSWIRIKWSWEFDLVVVALIVVIPFVFYIALKLWLEGEISPFPDIDHAWKAGLAELDRQAIDLAQTPLFLVIGSSGELQEKGIFEATRMSLNVRELPKGSAALHWYASADGVYVVCTDVGSLSKTAALGRQTIEEDSTRPGPAAPRSEGDSIRGTIVADGSSALLVKSAILGTASAPVQPALRTAGPIAGGDIRGTMMVGGAAAESENIDSGSAPPREKRVVRLDTNEANLQDRRLAYLCRLLRRKRLPLSPVNGILSLLPFGLIGRSVPESQEVQRATKRDLSVLERGLMVRCPVTAMVAGMEEHNGFQELSRRVGRERAEKQRIGHSFQLTNPPLPERLDALASHACGAFEDWVYLLFREKGSLSKPGNTKLYSLLCKIRRDVQNRLGNILAFGFGRDPDEKSEEQGMFFGGCYFSATGQSEDRQAFVRSVLEKLPEQQEELAWSDRAIHNDQKLQFLSNLFLGLDTLLLIGLIVLIVYRFHS
jgi:hypothetical protein